MSNPSHQRLRIGAVNYLNSKPLVEGLRSLTAQTVPCADLVLDYPSRLADGLTARELDVALIPSVECFRGDRYEVVSDACVAARGDVLSVKLYSRCPVEEIRTLALDEGSRTSAALVQVLLGERFGVFPDREPLPLEFTTEDSAADAILLIGDRAIHPPAERFAVTWDLGREWYEWTGLPFVFAMWATRADCELGEIESALGEARDQGEAQLQTIAAREAPLLAISENTACRYLTQNLHYRLGPREREGLRLFHQYVMKLGLAPEGADLVFRNCTPA